MKTCTNCGKQVTRLWDGLCALCSYYSTHPQGEPAQRESACYTTSGRHQAGEFAIIGVSVRDQQVLLTLQGSTWMSGDEEHDSGNYTSWYTPTDEEKQSVEYQRLAKQLAADLMYEEEATKRAQRQSEDPEIRAYRAELDAQESTGSALTAPEPERHEETTDQPASLSTALDSFLKSDDFKACVISSTKAGFGGSHYSVELFEDGTYRVLWANQIGNLYISPGAILTLPTLDDENLEEMEGWTEEEIQDTAFSLQADEFEQDLRRELDFILEQREEAAKQGWGGTRSGAGRPAQGDEVRVIRLVKSQEQVYSRSAGDTDVAIVKDGVCVSGLVRGQTGATVSTRDGRKWGWVGLDVEALKANGFTYSHTNAVYHGVKTGKEYAQLNDGSWERMDDEGPTPVRGKIEIVG